MTRTSTKIQSHDGAAHEERCWNHYTTLHHLSGAGSSHGKLRHSACISNCQTPVLLRRDHWSWPQCLHRGSRTWGAPDLVQFGILNLVPAVEASWHLSVVQEHCSNRLREKLGRSFGDRRSANEPCSFLKGANLGASLGRGFACSGVLWYSCRHATRYMRHYRICGRTSCTGETTRINMACRNRTVMTQSWHARPWCSLPSCSSSSPVPESSFSLCLSLSYLYIYLSISHSLPSIGGLSKPPGIMPTRRVIETGRVNNGGRPSQG